MTDDELGKVAFETFQRAWGLDKAIKHGGWGSDPHGWSALDKHTRERWVAVAKAVREAT